MLRLQEKTEFLIIKWAQNPNFQHILLYCSLIIGRVI
jgi:hypothetical protein